MRKFKQTKMLLIVALFAVITGLLSSCYPDYGLTTEDFDIVSTIKDDANNFQVYRTFYMPDTIKKVLDGGIIGSNNGQYDQQVLTEIANQMTAYGYTRVPAQSSADVSVLVGTSSSSTYTYYPGYWYGYYGWYYPWYGGYSYSYTTGSLFVEMVDNDKFNEASRNTGTVWVGIANGVLDNATSAELKARIFESIDKMFAQSPYLKIVQ